MGRESAYFYYVTPCVCVRLRCFDFRSPLPSSHPLVPMVRQYFLLFVFVFPCWNFAFFICFFIFYFDGIQGCVHVCANQQIVRPEAKGSNLPEGTRVILKMVKFDCSSPVDIKDA